MTTTLLVIAEEDPRSYGPVGERIRHIASAGNSFFDKVVVVTLRGQIPQAHNESRSGPILYSINSRIRMPFPISVYFDVIRFLTFLTHGFMVVRRCRPRLILTSIPPFEVGLASWILATVFRVRMIVDLMDDWEAAMKVQLSRYIPLTLMKPIFIVSDRIYSYATDVWVVGPTLAETIRKRRVSDSIVVAPNGADTSIFVPRDSSIRNVTRRRLGLPNNKIVLVYCGSGATHYYRLDLVIKAIGALPKNFRERFFTVCYVYSGASYLRRMKEASGLADDVISVRSAVPREVLSEVLAACDVGLVPFDDQSYLLYAKSTKLYEYLSAGLYVLASGPSEGELDSFLSHNENLGIFVSPSVASFATIFQRILDFSESMFTDQQRNTRHSFIKEHFDREKVLIKAMRSSRGTKAIRD